MGCSCSTSFQPATACRAAHCVQTPTAPHCPPAAVPRAGGFCGKRPVCQHAACSPCCISHKEAEAPLGAYSKRAGLLPPELALQGPRSYLMAQEPLFGEQRSLEWGMSSGMLCESEEGLPVSGLGRAVSCSSWLWKLAWGTLSLLAAWAENQNAGFKQAERKSVPVSLCCFDLHKCVTSPDALALKDHDTGQLTSLKVALCSLQACVLPGTEALDLSSMPMQLRFLLGRTPHLASHMGSWCVQELPQA